MWVGPNDDELDMYSWDQPIILPPDASLSYEIIAPVAKKSKEDSMNFNIPSIY
jgi:hypothetical protein